MLDPLIDVLLHVFSTWPKPDPYAVVSLALGLSGLYFNLDRLRKATTEGERRQRSALEQLKSYILDRVTPTRIEPKLLSPTSLRALALAVEKRTACTVITDKLIAEVVRSIALDLEDRFSGAQLTRRLELLNEALRALDTAGGAIPLLSIATTDRLYAYKQSQRFLIALVSIGLVILALLRLYVTSTWLLLAIAFAASLEIWFFVATSRAESYWKETIPEGEPPAPSSLGRFLDLFLLASLSRSRWAATFWHLLLAPLWEAPWLWSSNFLRSHQCRYWLARELEAEMHDIQKRIVRAAIRKEKLTDGDITRLVRLCRQLWVITGNSRFRELESQWPSWLEPPAELVVGTRRLASPDDGT